MGLGIISTCWPVNDAFSSIGFGQKGPKAVFNTSLEPSWRSSSLYRSVEKENRKYFASLHDLFSARGSKRGPKSQASFDWLSLRASGDSGKAQNAKAQVKRFFVKQIVAGIVKGFLGRKILGGGWHFVFDCEGICRGIYIRGQKIKEYINRLVDCGIKLVRK